MAFESLSDKLQNIFKNLKGKGKLSEADVKAALKEVKLALLEADVNFKVVKNFIKSIEERAVGEEVMESLTPGQMVIKIVNEEMVKLMGSETTELTLRPQNEITTIMMMGLQGAGKTTTTAKIAGQLKAKGRKPLLVACDIYRPAAIEQLQVNGKKQGVEVFSMGTGHKPVDITKAALEHAKKNDFNVVIIDTAGRLHIDEGMMDELVEIKDNCTIDNSVLVVDAMTGQDAVNVAKSFEEKIYVGMGEKLSDLQQFYPDRMASRILGMGDVLSLIEKAEQVVDEEKAKEYEKKFKKAEFNFEDYLEQMQQVKQMGGLEEVMNMLPGMGFGDKLKGAELPDEKAMGRVEAIIYSMTPEERRNPSILNVSRKNRIAAGAGVSIAEVNRLVKQFEQSKKLMKQMSGMMSGKKAKRGMFKFPF